MKHALQPVKDLFQWINSLPMRFLFLFTNVILISIFGGNENIRIFGNKKDDIDPFEMEIELKTVSSVRRGEGRQLEKLHTILF